MTVIELKYRTAAHLYLTVRREHAWTLEVKKMTAIWRCVSLNITGIWRQDHPLCRQRHL